jgi:hypothetical protein
MAKGADEQRSASESAEFQGWPEAPPRETRIEQCPKRVNQRVFEFLFHGFFLSVELQRAGLSDRGARSSPLVLYPRGRRAPQTEVKNRGRLPDRLAGVVSVF